MEVYYFWSPCSLIKDRVTLDLRVWSVYVRFVYVHHTPCISQGKDEEARFSDIENGQSSGDCVSHILTHLDSVMSFKWTAALDFFFETWTFECIGLAHVKHEHMCVGGTCSSTYCSTIFMQRTHKEHMKKWWPLVFSLLSFYRSSVSLCIWVYLSSVLTSLLQSCRFSVLSPFFYQSVKIQGSIRCYCSIHISI